MTPRDLAEELANTGSYVRRLQPNQVQEHVAVLEDHFDALPSEVGHTNRVLQDGAEMLYVSDGRLYAITVELDAQITPTVTVSNRHLDNGTTVSVETHGPTSTEWGYGYKTHWRFNFPNGDSLDLNGVILRQEGGTALFEDEKFARLLAGQVGFRRDIPPEGQA
jgi:hypothetical protein